MTPLPPCIFEEWDEHLGSSSLAVPLLTVIMTVNSVDGILRWQKKGLRRFPAKSEMLFDFPYSCKSEEGLLFSCLLSSKVCST